MLEKCFAGLERNNLDAPGCGRKARLREISGQTVFQSSSRFGVGFGWFRFRKPAKSGSAKQECQREQKPRPLGQEKGVNSLSSSVHVAAESASGYSAHNHSSILFAFGAFRSCWWRRPSWLPWRASCRPDLRSKFRDRGNSNASSAGQDARLYGSGWPPLQCRPTYGGTSDFPVDAIVNRVKRNGLSGQGSLSWQSSHSSSRFCS